MFRLGNRLMTEAGDYIAEGFALYMGKRLNIVGGNGNDLFLTEDDGETIERVDKLKVSNLIIKRHQ